MTRSSLLLASVLLASLGLASVTGCAMPEDEAPITKAEARAQASKADTGFDFCEVFDWYDDGICDDFCANPDPDCDGDQYCYSSDDCGEGLACNADEVCLSPCEPGEICPAVCAGFCVEEAPSAMCGGFANIPCANSDDWCSFGEVPTGASADMSGVCTERPEACIAIFDPVCGRDGQTYSNTCFANMAGVDAVAAGACN